MQIKDRYSPMNILRFSMTTWSGLGKWGSGGPGAEYIRCLSHQSAILPTTNPDLNRRSATVGLTGANR
jgi:hypothetical protein